MKRKQEIEISDKIIKALKEKGFQINKYYAKKTKSIYLKLDYGACCGVRISDHKGIEKYKYKFNVLKQYTGPKEIKDRGIDRWFYDYNNTEELINDIQNEKETKINKYGLNNYRRYMEENSKDKLYKSFKNVS